jgi:hypothetical protein
MLVVLMTICCREVQFWSSPFGVLEAFWCPEGFVLEVLPEWENFLKIWEIFCYYFIELAYLRLLQCP